MTMVQSVVEPTRAWIVGDSVCTSGPDILHGYEDHKLIALPKFVLTGLGSLALRHHAQGVAHTLQDVDDAIERLPKILCDGRQVLGLREHDAKRAGFVGHTLLVVGWSESRGHMVCVAFASGNDFEPELHGSAQQGSTVFWRNPDIPREPFSRYPDGAESLVNHAFATVAHWRSIDPCTPIGGTLRMAEITRGSIVVSVAGDLGQPAINETEHNMTSKTLAFVVAAALAGCGGTDDVEVTAGQLSPNAATVAQSATAASGTVTVTTNSFVEADATTLTWLNNTAGAVLVQIEHSGNLTSVTKTGTANGFGYMKGYWSVSGGGGSSGVVFGPLTAVGAAEANYSTVDQVSVGAGLTITVRCAIGAQEFIGTGNVVTNYANVFTRVTAIKR